MDEQLKNERLFCLDALRGLDMLLLTVIGPFFGALGRTVHLPDWTLRQFSHPRGGFTLWDIIMPLFIFMCGAAVPFGLGKRLEGGKAGVMLSGVQIWLVTTNAVRFTFCTAMDFVAVQSIKLIRRHVSR